MKRIGILIFYTVIVVYFCYICFTQRPEFIIHKDNLILTRSDDAYTIYVADTRNMDTEDYYAVAVNNKTQKIIPIQNISQLYRTAGSYSFLFGSNDSVYSYHYYSVERHDLKTGAKTTVLPKFSESYFKNCTTNEVAYQLHSVGFKDESNEFVALYTDNPLKRRKDFSLSERLSTYMDIYDANLNLIETIDFGVKIEPYEGGWRIDRIRDMEVEISFYTEKNPVRYIYNRNMGKLNRSN